MTHRTRRCTPPPTSLACPSTQTVPVGNLQQLSSFSEAAQRRCSASIWLCAEAQRAVNARKAGRSSNLSSYAVVEPSACSAPFTHMMPSSAVQLSLPNSKMKATSLLLSRLRMESTGAESDLWRTNKSTSQ